MGEVLGSFVACASDSAGSVLPARWRGRSVPGEVHREYLGVPRCSV